MFLAIVLLALAGGRADAAPPEPSAHAGLAALGAPVEVPSLRTRTSRTFRMPDGTHVAQLYTGSVNFRAADREWTPIDTEFGRSSRAGYAHRNAANRFALELPDRLDGAPVRFAADGEWVEFALEGARSATPSIDGGRARYPGALTGVDLQYDLRRDGVKETLVLASGAAPSVYRFSMRTSSGVSAQKNDAGGIDFLTRSGERVFGFAPPSLEDAAGRTSTAAELSISGDDRRYDVTLRADRDWLDAPGRAWPVSLDPTVQLPVALECAYIKSTGGTSSTCGGPRYIADNTGGGSIRRPMMKFNVAAGVPPQALVLSARMLAHGDSEGTVDAYPVTKPWTMNANWARYDGVNNWTNAGGDWDATARVTGAGPGNAYWSFYMTDIVQSWADGSRPNHGIMLQSAPSDDLRFPTAMGMDSELAPYLEVIYEPRLGALPRYTFHRYQLTPEASAEVNVANGNLLVSEEDVAFDDSDLEYDVGHYYNRQSTGFTPTGPRWTLGKSSPDVRLEILGDGVAFYGPTGYAVPFLRRADGTYRSPVGVNADLLRNVDGSYTLTWRDSGDELRFNSVGRLTAEDDRDEGTLAFAYSGTPTLMRSISDSESRVTNAVYDASNRLTELRPPGAVHTFGHGASGDPGNLTSYRAPNGRQTTYTYAGQLLSRIQDYAGGDMTITYDTQHRVNTITRATGNGNQVTQFTYGAGTTTVSGGGTPTATYVYDRDQLVTSSTAGGSPPALTLSGTLWDRRNLTLTDRTAYNLHVAATESSGVDIEISVDGDEVDFVEQACTQSCGTFHHDFSFHTDEYTPGEYVVTVAAIDNQGDERTQTFKVTVPATADDPEPAATQRTRTQRFNQATAFRNAFGMNADAAHVNATIDDPALAPSEQQWGVPVTVAEEQELFTRVAVGDKLDTVDRYGTGAGRADFAGAYIDQDQGGLVYVGWTANSSTHMAQLQQLYAYPTRLRSFTAARTQIQLEGLKAQVTADLPWFAQQGIPVVAFWTDVEGNRITVGTPAPTPSQQTLVTQRFGAGVVLVARPASVKERRRAVRPLIAGLRIFHVGSCTSNVNVYGDRTTGRTNRKRRYFTLTAGHCGNRGTRWYQSTHTDVDRRRTIGVIAQSTIQDAGTGRTDADAALVDTRANGKRPPRIAFSSAANPTAASRRVVRTGRIAPILSLRRPATATSRESDATQADRAVDGDSRTRWRSATFAAGNQLQSWQVDLQSVQSIDSVVLRWDAQFARDYTVETSSDGSNWTVRGQVAGATVPMTREHEFAAVDARHVRVVMTAATGALQYAFSEAEVYAAGESTLTQGDHIGDMVCNSGFSTNRVVCGRLVARDVDGIDYETGPSATIDDQREWTIDEQEQTSIAGDSGGPVFVPRNARRTRLMIIGVHAYGYDPHDNDRQPGDPSTVSGFSHIANALTRTRTSVCTPRRCRR